MIDDINNTLGHDLEGAESRAALFNTVRGVHSQTETIARALARASYKGMHVRRMVSPHQSAAYVESNWRGWIDTATALLPIDDEIRREEIARLIVPYGYGCFENQERKEDGSPWKYPPGTPNARAYELADAILALGPTVSLGWRPIETAPKDGSWIIAISNDHTQVEHVYWQADQEAWYGHHGAYGDGLFAPHGGWIPAPAPRVLDMSTLSRADRGDGS